MVAAQAAWTLRSRPAQTVVRCVLLRVVLDIFFVVGLGERRGGELVFLLHPLHRQAPVVLAGAQRQLALRVDLEGDHRPRFAGLAPRDALDLPPAVAVQLLGGAAGAAQDVDEETLVAVLAGGEALGGAGGDLAALRDQLRDRAAGLLDRDGLAQRGRPRLLLAGRREDEEQHCRAPSHCCVASASASPRIRSASSIWPLFTIIGGAMRMAFP